MHLKYGHLGGCSCQTPVKVRPFDIVEVYIIHTTVPRKYFVSTNARAGRVLLLSFPSRARISYTMRSSDSCMFLLGHRASTSGIAFVQIILSCHQSHETFTAPLVTNRHLSTAWQSSFPGCPIPLKKKSRPAMDHSCLSRLWEQLELRWVVPLHKTAMNMNTNANMAS